MRTLPASRLVAAHRAASPFDGDGARLFGGRWNSKGKRAVYAAESEALALLEVLVHLVEPYQLTRFQLLQIEIPASEVQRLSAEALPQTWREDPPPPETAAIGDAWLAEAGRLALAVPSTIAARDWNYLLNPNHAAFVDVVNSARRLDLDIDGRLYPRGRAD